MLHNLTIGHFDASAIRDRKAVVVKPLDMHIVRRLLAELGRTDDQGQWRLGRGKVELRDGYVVVPWHGRGTASLSEEFALGLHRETGCMLADREHGRIVAPEELRGLSEGTAYPRASTEAKPEPPTPAGSRAHGA
jgi:hypothetical protein